VTFWSWRTGAVFVVGTVGALACRSAPASSRPADLVLFGRVWTGDSARPWAGGLAVKDDRIIEVGDSAVIARLAGKGTTRVGNGRAMIAPGFIDSHVHLLSGGFQIARVNLRDASSPAEFIRGLKQHADSLPPGEWITGGDWDHERWPGSPLPERSWIDSVTPRNPVFVNRLDGHMSLANTAALRLAHITRATRDVPGGTVVRDRRTGEPTGLLKDNARDLVERVKPIPSPAQCDSALARAMRWAAAHGVTGYRQCRMTPVPSLSRAPGESWRPSSGLAETEP
jgi:predicted amidohydrolase YtcJ